MALNRYSAARPGLYAFLWVVALVELGLTGYRIHHTESSPADDYDPVVVSLLVTAALTLLWVPFGIFTALRDTTSRYVGIYHELGASTILWIMWLVETAVATHKWPTRDIARSFAAEKDPSDANKQGSVLITIVAFGWIAFGLLYIIQVFLAMHYAHVAAGAPVASTTTSKTEKTPVAPAPAPVSV